MNLLLPVPVDRRLRRLLQLYFGLAVYGFSTALMVEAVLGLNPWDVFHQGLAERTGITIGISTIVTGAAVMVMWLPLRQRPGLGTISNAVLIGVAVDLSLAVLAAPESLVVRSLFLAGGITLNGVATGLYIGAGLGAGPRDGLMTGIAARGYPVAVVRTGLELIVLAIGWALGGTIGLGTIAYAIAIGPLAHIFIPLFTLGRVEPVLPPEGHTSIP